MTEPSDIDRQALIEATLGYVRHLASKVARDLPQGVALDDLVSAGHVGLVDAAKRYDPKRGAGFTTFAHYRIRGAILDYVRDVAADHPVYRSRAIAEAAVDDLIEQRLGEERAGPPLSSTSQADAAHELSLVLGEMATAFNLAEIAAETAAVTEPDPEAALIKVESARRLDEALSAIPEREAAMLRAVYFDGHTIEHVGKTMGLSKSWASRIHAQALAGIRRKIERTGGGL